MEKSHAHDFFMGPVWISGYVDLLTIKIEFVFTQSQIYKICPSEKLWISCP